jgi:hypothetical protein
MTALPPTSEQRVLYEERQRIPFLSALLTASLCAILVAIGGGVALLTGAALDRFDMIFTAAFVGLGLFYGFLTGRRIRLRPDALWVGWQVFRGGNEIPLAAVTQTGILRGRELRRVRLRIAMPRSKSEPLLLGGAIPIPGVGLAFVGGYLLATRAVRQGNCCPPGQGPAVFLSTPTLGTPLWIVGTPRPEELLAAINDARSRLPQLARREGRSDDESGWLPPPRER